MKNDVFIVDSAVCTALGPDLDSTWEKLLDGESAAAPVEHFDTSSFDYHNAACIRDLHSGTYANRVLELARRVIDQLTSVPEDTFVIWAGVKDNVEFVQRVASSNSAAEDLKELALLPRDYRNYVCDRLKLKAGGMELNAACTSSSAAVGIASAMISRGDYSSVLVCAADIVSRFVFTGFASLKALSPTVCRPFDRDRDGLMTGDAAAAVLLMNPERAEKYTREPESRISGWGIADDANHITGPARDGCGLIGAIELAMKTMHISEKIEAFCAHGTGTVYNDAMELTACETVFGADIPPLFSVKGALGHTMGAAGALELALSSRALREKRIPPTFGLRNPEERASGLVSNDACPIPGNNILTTNSGFGGINAALILESIRGVS